MGSYKKRLGTTAVESWLTMNDQRMLLQLPNYFSNLTNVGKTLTANLRNMGKMLVLNIGPEFCEVDSTIWYNYTAVANLTNKPLECST